MARELPSLQGGVRVHCGYRLTLSIATQTAARSGETPGDSFVAKTNGPVLWDVPPKKKTSTMALLAGCSLVQREQVFPFPFSFSEHFFFN